MRTREHIQQRGSHLYITYKMSFRDRLFLCVAKLICRRCWLCSTEMVLKFWARPLEVGFLFGL